jgi:hypothetical protein
MRGFSIRRDIKHVQWGPTLQVAFVRAFGMALTMVIVFLNAILRNEIAGITSGTDAVLFLGVVFIAYVVSATLLYPILGFISWYLTSLYVYFPIFGFFWYFLYYFYLCRINRRSLCFLSAQAEAQMGSCRQLQLSQLCANHVRRRPEIYGTHTDDEQCGLSHWASNAAFHSI